ncbi:Pkinase-domain-containing protein [Gonapodya prolifera JEL478]|uniref:Pkinase-domain-containing protein n=1 Tax=Gonapodya prolifera (strain JEL478) TaxID=1344416 RepID=A0A139ANN5_GONPJ|nr:Pkinase-domain-containing protein [Gonapodya prolifera JEL478]|eukprot:KXS18367.1 Pkinase-domain-containing protein [Gonapodya prolifera JEL478]
MASFFGRVFGHKDTKDVARSSGKNDLVFQEKSKEYKEIRLLGEGSQGTVKLALHVPSKRHVAIKSIRKAAPGLFSRQTAAPVAKDESTGIPKECEILSKIRHPHVVELIEWFESRTHYHLVFELATGGELFDRILERGSFTEKDAAVIVATVLSAVAFLHDHDIVHRDLKLQNLMFKDPSADSSLCIVDFGFATRLPSPGNNGKGNSELLKTMLGTIHTRAPEIFLDIPYKGKPVDMWAIGCIAYTLLCGYSPFHDAMDMGDLLDRVTHCRYTFDPSHWSAVTPAAQSFIRGILRLSPDKRLSAHDALNHDWIRSMVPGEYLEYLEMVNEECWCREKGLPYGSISAVPGSSSLGISVDDDDDEGLEFNAIGRPPRDVGPTPRGMDAEVPSKMETTAVAPPVSAEALSQPSSAPALPGDEDMAPIEIPKPTPTAAAAVHSRVSSLPPLSSSLSRQLLSSSSKTPEQMQSALGTAVPEEVIANQSPALSTPPLPGSVSISTPPLQALRPPVGRTVLELASGTPPSAFHTFIDTSPRRVPSYPSAPLLTANLVSLSNIMATGQSAQDGVDPSLTAGIGSPPQSPSTPEPNFDTVPETTAAGIPIPNRRQTVTPPITREGSSLGQQFSLRDLREFQALASGSSIPPASGGLPSSLGAQHPSLPSGYFIGRGGSISPHAGLRRRGTPETISSIRRNNSIDRLDGVPFHASTPPSSSPLAMASAAERTNVRRVPSLANALSNSSASISRLTGTPPLTVGSVRDGTLVPMVGTIAPNGHITESPDSESSRYLKEYAFEPLRSEPLASSSPQLHRGDSQLSLSSGKSVKSARILDIVDILEGDSPSRRGETNLVGTADAIRRYRRTTEEVRSSSLAKSSWMDRARLAVSEGHSNTDGMTNGASEGVDAPHPEKEVREKDVEQST